MHVLGEWEGEGVCAMCRVGKKSLQNSPLALIAVVVANKAASEAAVSDSCPSVAALQVFPWCQEQILSCHSNLVTCIY